MRTCKMIRMAFVAILMCVNFAACSDDDDGNIPNYLVGLWYGEHTASLGTAYLYVDFYSNSTGELYLESPTGAFTQVYLDYSVSGDIVNCNGAYGSTMAGGSSGEWAMKFRLENERLIPIDKYTTFILTKR